MSVRFLYFMVLCCEICISWLTNVASNADFDHFTTTDVLLEIGLTSARNSLIIKRD